GLLVHRGMRALGGKRPLAERRERKEQRAFPGHAARGDDRPIATSTATIRDVGFTSIRDVASAQMAAIPPRSGARSDLTGSGGGGVSATRASPAPVFRATAMRAPRQRDCRSPEPWHHIFTGS